MSARREVFYAAYGSNLSARRFECYIAGGTAPGSQRALRGARDRRLPESDPPRQVRLRGSLYFAGSAQTWGGGAPAFFEPATAADQPVAAVFGRAWRLGWDQFEDVLAQENGRDVTHPLEIDPADLVDGFSVNAGPGSGTGRARPGRYCRVVCVGDLDGLPVLTCTASEPTKSLSPPAPAAPAPEYLAHIITGLRETFDLDDAAIVAYLGAAPGATPHLVRAALDG